MYEVAEHGGKVAIFNTERVEGDEQSDFIFLGPCEETLPRALFDFAAAKGNGGAAMSDTVLAE